ncbi:Xaa-Pro aminopeptidase [Cohnella sp. OV330]|uniref:M24 family metallopeptidase n=1 Tax=Cohnella sp. OV330 TaxID=1855288 RepID=UPI0008EC5307|nr:M24 family metallopeptidase [Cohnella sp. OV330]SFB50587.1 Xaa-Pro aminopeptidase [Cohnella sp. OV330]
MNTTETARRTAVLQSALAKQGIEALVAYGSGPRESAGMLRYLTGYMPANTEAFLVVPAKGRPVVVSADKNRARAFKTRLGDEMKIVKTTDLTGALKEEVASAAPRGGLVAQAGEFDMTTALHAEFRAILEPYEVTDGYGIVTGQRLKRTAYEAEKHRQATAIADKLVAHAMSIAAIPGVTGPDIMAEVEYLGRRLGADQAGCWLAVGERPAETYFDLFELTEAVGPNARVQIGATVCLDGYYSQVLRIGMFAEPSDRMKEVSERLIAMQDAALARMVPGTPIHEIVDALETMIDAYCPYTRLSDPFRFQSTHAMSNSYSDPGAAPFLNAGRDKSRDAESPLVAEHQVYEVHPNFTLPDVGHVCAGDVAVVGGSGATWMSQYPRGIVRLA